MASLKGQCHGILRVFLHFSLFFFVMHKKNYLQIEGNLEIKVLLR